MLGWAVEVGAHNLVTEEPTADPRDEASIKVLERLHFYGNNGWTRGFGRDQALRILGDHGYIDPSLVLGYMLAHGHHGKSIERLAALLP